MQIKRKVVGVVIGLGLMMSACPGELIEQNNPQAQDPGTDRPVPTLMPGPGAPGPSGPGTMVPESSQEDEDQGSGPQAMADMGMPGDDGMPPDPDEDMSSGGPDMVEPVVDMPPPAPQGVPIFVAQGHMGRTTISCDDGRSWVANRDFGAEGHALACGKVQATARCWDDANNCEFIDNGTCRERDSNCDCDHHPGAGNGITWGDGWFVATFGWGPRGGVMRSRDGVTWEMVIQDTTYANVAYGQGTFVTGARDPKVSSDGAMTWQDGGEADLRAPNGETVYNPRRLGFADVMGGRFVLTGESGERRDVLVSSDGGATWQRPNPLPADCAAGVRGIAGGNGRIVITTRHDKVCVSSDGGQSFVSHDMSESPSTTLMFDGQRFVTFGRGKMLTSPDGESWTSRDTTPSLALGAVARNPSTGTYVAVNGQWGRWYENQEFYRSTDGITWTTLDAQDYTASHPMRYMTFGWAPPGTSCPSN